MDRDPSVSAPAAVERSMSRAGESHLPKLGVHGARTRIMAFVPGPFTSPGTRGPLIDGLGSRALAGAQLSFAGLRGPVPWTLWGRAGAFPIIKSRDFSRYSQGDPCRESVCW